MLCHRNATSIVLTMHRLTGVTVRRGRDKLHTTQLSACPLAKCPQYGCRRHSVQTQRVLGKEKETTQKNAQMNRQTHIPSMTSRVRGARVCIGYMCYGVLASHVALYKSETWAEPCISRLHVWLLIRVSIKKLIFARANVGMCACACVSLCVRVCVLGVLSLLASSASHMLGG